MVVFEVFYLCVVSNMGHGMSDCRSDGRRHDLKIMKEERCKRAARRPALNTFSLITGQIQERQL